MRTTPRGTAINIELPPKGAAPMHTHFYPMPDFPPLVPAGLRPSYSRLENPTSVSEPPVSTPRKSQLIRESIENERQYVANREAMCNQLAAAEEAEIAASAARVEAEQLATKLVAEEQEKNRVVAECLARKERAREDFLLRQAELNAAHERMRIAEAEFERASADSADADAQFENESVAALSISREARGAEVGLMNTRAEEDRCVKERAAVESTAHEAYHLGAPLGPAGGYPGNPTRQVFKSAIDAEIAAFQQSDAWNRY